MGKTKDVELMFRGKLTDFLILFDQAEDVFHAGSTISGQVIVELNEPMKMRNIHLLLHGESQIHWVVVHSSGKYRSYSYYDSEENYLDQTLQLYGSDEGEHLHPAGRHTYPFSFQLPESLPTSVEGEHGYIRYLCKATIHKPWKFDYDAKRLFTVLGRLDLNAEPGNLMAPVRAESQSKVSCCCCVSGDVKGNVSTDRGAYVPGETIIVNAEVVNASNSKVLWSRVVLEQHTQFLGYNTPRFSSKKNLDPRVEISVLAQKIGEPVKARQTGRFENVALQIPSVPPSRLDNCNFINTTYVIKLLARVKMGKDIELSSAVVVGTVPFHQQGQEDGHHVPSFEEQFGGRRDTKGKDDSEYTRGQLEWAPRYPTYKVAGQDAAQPSGHLYPQL